MAQFIPAIGFGNGQDGVVSLTTATDAPIDASCTGTSGTNTLSATNASFAAGQVIIIHQTRGSLVWEINKIRSYVAGTITTSYQLANTYTTGAQVLVLKQYSRLTIGAGQTITGKSWNGTTGGLLAYMVASPPSITGALTITGCGFRGGAGVGSGFGVTGGVQGEGATGTGTGTTSANGIGGGGGSGDAGNQGSGGGGGGYATAGTAGAQYNGVNPTVGAAGGTIGTANLTTLSFGGGGGGGGKGSGVNGPGGDGGVGGGAIMLFAPSLSIGSATLAASGTNGSNGSSDGTGGGAGAGGSIFLTTKSAILGTVTATGGVGGVNSLHGGGNGGNGGNGRVHLNYVTTYTGSSTPSLDAAQSNAYNTNYFGFLI